MYSPEKAFSHSHSRGTYMSRLIKAVSSHMLASRVYRVVIVLTWFVYIGVAIAGCFDIVEGLNPKNLVPTDNYVHQYFDTLTDFWHVGPQLHVIVQRPPNLAQVNACKFDPISCN